MRPAIRKVSVRENKGIESPRKMELQSSDHPTPHLINQSSRPNPRRAIDRSIIHQLSFSRSIHLRMRHLLLFPRQIPRTPISRLPKSIRFASAISCTMSTKASGTSVEPTFSTNYDPEQASRDLSPLLRGNGGKWTLMESGKGVERSFKFRTFKKTWACCTFFVRSSINQCDFSVSFLLVGREGKARCTDGM